MEITSHDYCWIVKNVFDESIQSKMIERIELLKESGVLEYHQKTKRFYKQNDKLFNRLHLKIFEIVQKIVPEKIKPSYNFISYYDSKDSQIFLHRDRHACFYTVSYCVRQSAVWPIVIKDVEYSLNPNELIIFRGNRDEHYRNRYANEGDVIQVLFHFVEENYKGVLAPHPSNENTDQPEGFGVY